MKTTNLFKNNSRFAALAEDYVSECKETLKFKNEPNSFVSKNETNSFKRLSYNYGNINKISNCSKEQIEKNKAAKFATDMAQENFPILVTEKLDNKTQINYLSFLSKLNTTVIKEKNMDDDLDYTNLNHGYALIKKNNLSGKIIIQTKEKIILETIKKTEPEIAYVVFEALANLHEKKTNEYIETWEYDEWEKMFKFSNYDYEYFDNFDEKIEEEMEILCETEDT